MHEESVVKMKLEEETKFAKEICEKLQEVIKSEFANGTEHVDTEEMGEVIDMWKDVCEGKEKIIKACYYKQIMEAMEESEYGEDYDEDGPMEKRYYRGQRRDSRGRYTSKRYYESPIMMNEPYMHMSEDMRDMDLNEGRMYAPYSSNSGRSSGSRSNSSSNSNSRYGYSYDKYMNNRRNYKKDEPEGNRKRMEELDEFMEDLEDMARNVISDMSPTEKQAWKAKLNKLVNM